MVIDQEREGSCKRIHQRTLLAVGLSIATLLVGVAAFTGPAVAQDAAIASVDAVATVAVPGLKIDTGDSAWVLMSTAMV